MSSYKTDGPPTLSIPGSVFSTSFSHCPDPLDTEELRRDKPASSTTDYPPTVTRSSRNHTNCFVNLRFQTQLGPLAFYQSNTPAQPTPKMSHFKPAFFASPFSLPLHSEFIDPDYVPAPGRGLEHFREMGVKPEFGEFALNKAPQLKSVEYWTGVIEEKKCGNPGWVREWLETYGANAFAILSDTQLAALLGVPLDRMCRENLHRHTLLASKLFPSTMALWRKGALDSEVYDKQLKKRNSHPRPNYLPTRQSSRRLKLAAEQRLPNYQPARPSPLRQSHTVEDEPSSPALSSPCPSEPHSNSSEQASI
jgi:hypothetical protein